MVLCPRAEHAPRPKKTKDLQSQPNPQEAEGGPDRIADALVGGVKDGKLQADLPGGMPIRTAKK